MIKIIGAIFSLAFVFCSCEGIFSNIYDTQVKNEDDDKLKNVYGFTSYDAKTRRGTLYLNLSEFDRWIYLSFEDKRIDTVMIPKTLTGEWDNKSGIHYHYVNGLNFSLDSVVKTDTQKDPKKWDIALHKYEGKVNGGVLETSYTSLDELPPTAESFDLFDYTPDQWIDTLVMTDIGGMLNYYVGYQYIQCSKVLSNWLVMNITNPPPTYTPSNRVYIVRLSNNKKIALHFDNYMSPSGTKGFVTISFIYPY
ncbi:MAG: HmuY family protein [Bacteroidales bacterium]